MNVRWTPAAQTHRSAALCCVDNAWYLLRTRHDTTRHTAAYDYEVLETLGDSFLKLAVSAHLFMQHPHGQEGLYALSLSCVRGCVRWCACAVVRWCVRPADTNGWAHCVACGV